MTKVINLFSFAWSGDGSFLLQDYWQVGDRDNGGWFSVDQLGERRVSTAHLRMFFLFMACRTEDN